MRGCARDASVAIVVSTRDRPLYVGRLLDAIHEGEVLPSEVVVVDQSRDDSTERMLERTTYTAPIDYVRDSGLGLGRSQNIGFERSSSAVVAVTDDDCVPAREWLARLQAGLGADRDLAAITGPVLPLGPTDAGRFPVATRTSRARRVFHGRGLPWNVGSGNNFAVRREWLQRIGGNDERLGPGSRGQGGVDLDLFYRLLRAGGRILYEPSAVVYHEQATREDRLARRSPYGFGVGAGCVLRLTERDAFAAWVFARWLGFRGRRLAGALARGNWLRAHEEVLVLAGTLRGAAAGLGLRSSDS